MTKAKQSKAKVRGFILSSFMLLFFYQGAYACSSYSYGKQLHSIEEEFQSRLSGSTGFGFKEAEDVKRFAKEIYNLSDKCYNQTSNSVLENKYLNMRRYSSGLYDSANDFINARRGSQRSLVGGLQKYSKDENFGILDFALAAGGVMANDESAGKAKERIFHYLDQMESISKTF